MTASGCAQASVGEADPGELEEAASDGGSDSGQEDEPSGSGGAVIVDETSTGGSGGEPSVTPGTGGSDLEGSGGSGSGGAATGGSSSGGAVSSGGAPSSGGAVSSGGAPSSGGSPSSSLPLKLEAESAILYDCNAEPGGDSGSKVVGYKGGSVITFAQVDLTDVGHILFHVGAPYAGGQIEARVDSSSGTLLGTLTINTATGDWSSPNLASLGVDLGTMVSGVHDLVLLALPHPNGWVASVDYIELSESP